jgi:hypothetical protein
MLTAIVVKALHLLLVYFYFKQCRIYEVYESAQNLHSVDSVMNHYMYSFRLLDADDAFPMKHMSLF